MTQRGAVFRTVPRRLGYRVTVVGLELPDWAAPFVDAYIAADTDAPVLTDTVRLLAQPHAHDPFGGVVTYWDHGVVACAAIGTALGLPAMSPAAAERVRNKAVSRDALVAASVAQPRYARVSDATSLGEAALLVGFPAIYDLQAKRRRRQRGHAVRRAGGGNCQPLEWSPRPS
ncbi:hypothetical protein [Jatrophihabitans lederbergiae]|uniref:BL00235/CARNS1 N-terminal domain-containing protein n=1 Tax=Jatrophihabitans lederbergiae TaxID=3075547 RepID=A0ABU2J7R0_9ACTN|nr:hypothetical protein [Jatrophihabitans sp. DSM 44399]MDT0261027.1 hypothetical protein [Jatrophihabitans sp. DSM 44399]